jgi:hypothetical protein
MLLLHKLLKEREGSLEGVSQANSKLFFVLKSFRRGMIRDPLP